ncbi:MAG: carbohydrate ABC transporter permease [Clostridia bacterium]|nr:carbohydrate ABC transporter permease [Clostridia bacterium]MBR7172891.1 carbohydrate ABC transporter permease [Clostridia bacterium]
MPSNSSARTKRFIIKALEYFALLLATFIALLPLVSSFMISFKTAEEYGSTNAMTPPVNWLNFGNYVQVWNDGDMPRAFLTSGGVVVVVVAVSVMMGSMLAYVLNRFRFPGNNLIRNMFMIATLIPGIAMQVTTYQIMKDLGFLNSIVGYAILMSGTDVISIYIFLQYFENLDVALDESAVLEGCTYFGVFFKILLPLTKPAIITVAVLKGVGVYNEYYNANLYLQSNSWRTISTALYSFSGPFKSSYNIICAGVLLTLIPSLIIFLFFQKQVYAGLASGSVKG